MKNYRLIYQDGNLSLQLFQFAKKSLENMGKGYVNTAGRNAIGKKYLVRTNPVFLQNA